MEIVGYSREHSILADLHTHTTFSLHAYGTVDENAKTAFENGMWYVAITDHYYQFSDPIMRVNEITRMSDLKTVKPEAGAIIISGGEFNVGHKLADDIDRERLYTSLLWRPVGLHSWFVNMKDLDVKLLPYMFDANILGGSYVIPTALAHIERGIRNCKNSDNDEAVIKALKEIVNAAVDNDIYLEINESSFKYGDDTIKLMIEWASYAKERDAKFCLGTDAHSRENVGVFTETKRFIKDLGLNSCYILNYDRNALNELV